MDKVDLFDKVGPVADPPKESCKIFKVYQDMKGAYIRINQNCLAKADFKAGDQFDFKAEQGRIDLRKIQSEKNGKTNF